MEKCWCGRPPGGDRHSSAASERTSTDRLGPGYCPSDRSSDALPGNRGSRHRRTRNHTDALSRSHPSVLPLLGSTDALRYRLFIEPPGASPHPPPHGVGPASAVAPTIQALPGARVVAPGALKPFSAAQPGRP